MKILKYMKELFLNKTIQVVKITTTDEIDNWSKYVLIDIYFKEIVKVGESYLNNFLKCNKVEVQNIYIQDVNTSTFNKDSVYLTGEIDNERIDLVLI